MKKWLGMCSGMLAIAAMGLFAINCGGGDGNGGCKSNTDCPGENEYCDLNTGECVCAPACSGKCCGDDGCDGTCPNECPAGQTCNQTSCECEADASCTDGETRCNGDVVEECIGGAWQQDVDCTDNGQTCQNGECVGGQECTAGDSQCDGTVVQNCVAGSWVDGTDCADNGEECLNGECQPAAGCTQGDTRCNGTVVQTCDANDTWQDTTDCADNGETCYQGECQPAGGCTQGDTRCDGSVLQTCDANDTWQDTEDCADSGEICSAGACIPAGGGDECPDGQDCTDVTGSGFLGCTVDGSIPQDAPTGCSEESPCDGNATCLDAEQTTVCVSNCGTCPSGQLCGDITGTGKLGCTTFGGSIPQGAEEDCAQDGCSGNNTCYCLNEECTQSVCIENCSLDGPCTAGQAYCDGDVVMECQAGTFVAGENCANSGQVCFDGACASGDLCPEGLECIGITASGADGPHACVTPDSQIPPGAETGCSQQVPCSEDNFACWNTGDGTVCLENCGTCPDGQDCQDVTGQGDYACVLPDGSVPADAQQDCVDNGCNGNASCWCLDANCAESICLFNCSVPH